MKNEQYKAKLEEKYEVGENMKTATTRALKRRDDLLRDNLHNSPERKALLREGLKRRDVRMWKIIVGDPRQNCRDWRSLSTTVLEGILEILGTETKAPRWETLSAAARYLKFENYLSLSHSV